MMHIFLLNSLRYLTMVICIILGNLISGVLLVVSYLVSSQAPDPEKTSSYECGFEPFDDARNRFDVRFYIVAILFLIFDVEVAYLFPWTVTLGRTGYVGYSNVAFFLLLLVVGFAYEWARGALESH
jgi:NADH:ubiquinone oxidoreductase subunit 3 (subunit A)